MSDSSSVEWSFVDTGLSVTVTIDIATGMLTVKALQGSLDVNALWLSDGDASKEGSWSLAKSDNSLNMNGTGVTWDDMVKLSSTGLGQSSIDVTPSSSDGGKATYLEAGESFSISLAKLAKVGGLDANYLDYDAAAWASLTMGLRATSTSGGSGKLVDKGGTIIDGGGSGGDGPQTINGTVGGDVYTLDKPAVGNVLEADVIIYTNANQSPLDYSNPLAGADTIIGFEFGTDKIDLRGLLSDPADLLATPMSGDIVLIDLNTPSSQYEMVLKIDGLDQYLALAGSNAISDLFLIT